MQVASLHRRTSSRACPLWSVATDCWLPSRVLASGAQDIFLLTSSDSESPDEFDFRDNRRRKRSWHVTSLVSAQTRPGRCEPPSPANAAPAVRNIAEPRGAPTRPQHDAVNGRGKGSSGSGPIRRRWAAQSLRDWAGTVRRPGQAPGAGGWKAVDRIGDCGDAGRGGNTVSDTYGCWCRWSAGSAAGPPAGRAGSRGGTDSCTRAWPRVMR